MLLNIVYRRIYRFRYQFKFIIFIYQTFTFWHQVLQNKTSRFRTKEYLVFAPNTFFILPILEVNSNVFAPCSELWCESVTNT